MKIFLDTQNVIIFSPCIIINIVIFLLLILLSCLKYLIWFDYLYYYYNFIQLARILLFIYDCAD